MWLIERIYFHLDLEYYDRMISRIKLNTIKKIAMIKKITFFIMFLFIFLMWINQPAFAVQPIHLYLLIGQSNMSGRGEIPDVRYTNKNIIMFGNDYIWKRAIEPVDTPRNQIDKISLDEQEPGIGYGLSMSFAKRMRELTKYKIGLIPCAKSGSGIIEWIPSKSRSTLYGSCVRRAKIALRHSNTVLSGIIVFQGETDSELCTHARDWDKHFAYIVKSIRRDLEDKNLRIVFARLGEYVPRQNPCWYIVKNSQSKVNINNVSMLNTNSVPHVDINNVHYDSGGYDQLGIMFAESMAAMMK